MKIALCLLIASLLISCSNLRKDSSERNVTEVHFQYFDNRILLPIEINGQGPFYMIFDTGGSNMLMPDTLKRLGLKAKDAGFGGGAGDGELPIQLTKINSYKVGNIEMNNQDFLVMDLSHIKKAFGFKNLDGIIGHELLQKYVVTINYDVKQLIFTSFDDFKPEGKTIKFEIYGDKPVIKSEVTGIPTEFLVDTGDRSSFTLFRPFSKKHKISSYFSKNEVISGYGAGGPIPARLGKLPSLKLGENQVTLANISSRLPVTQKGFFATSTLGGSVGNGILQDFIVSFNYRDKEMTLRPGLRKNGEYKFIPPNEL